MTYFIYNFIQLLINENIKKKKYGGSKKLGYEKIIDAAENGNIKKLNELWKNENDSFNALQYVVAHGKHGDPIALIAIENGDLELLKWTYEADKVELLTHDIYTEILAARELKKNKILDWIDKNVDSLDNYD